MTGIHEDPFLRFKHSKQPLSERAHIPVLLDETLNILKSGNGYQIRVLLDATLGAGGHAAAILLDHCKVHCLIGNDRDRSALDLGQDHLKSAGLLPPTAHFWHCDLESAAAKLGECGIRCDAMIVDLGVSTMQLMSQDRGFSIDICAPLDMRMDIQQELTAAHIVNRYSPPDLEAILIAGEVRGYRKIARGIAQARAKKEIETTTELLKIVGPYLRGKTRRSAARVLFQALRIEVNQELATLENSLTGLAQALSDHGRLIAISFHSLEDRIVKSTFRELVNTGSFHSLTRKPLAPTAAERSANPRCRSAKLRALTRRDLRGVT